MSIIDPFDQPQQKATGGIVDPFDVQQPVAVQPLKREVGIGEAFVDDFKTGANKIARAGTAIAGLPLLALDAAARGITGEETGASEWWAKNVFGRYQGFVDDAEQKQRETQRSIPAQVGGAVGQLVTMAPELIAGNKVQQAVDIAAGTKPLAEMLVRGFAGAQPMAAHAGAERFADATAAGADTLSAANAALASYGNMAVQGVAPMGAAGGVGKRIVTGAAVNPVLGAGGRVMENAVNAPSGVKELQQPVVSAEQAIVDAILGAGMHGVMGSKDVSVQRPADVAADRARFDQQQAVRQQFIADGWKEFGPLLEANGIKPTDPRAERAISALTKHRADQQLRAEEKAAETVPPSPEEQAMAAKKLPDVISVDSTGRADAGDVGVKVGMMSAEGERAKLDKQATQAFDIADRRQRQADADLAARDQIDPDYQGGGAAARGGVFDSGMRNITLLDGQTPIEIISPVLGGKERMFDIRYQDGEGAWHRETVSEKRVSEHQIPQNQRLAQDFTSRSTVPPSGVGVETMAGEKMPRQSTDRISGDRVGGIESPIGQGRDVGPVEGIFERPGEGGLPPPKKQQRQGETYDGRTATTAMTTVDGEGVQRPYDNTFAPDGSQRIEGPKASGALPHPDSPMPGKMTSTPDGIRPTTYDENRANQQRDYQGWKETVGRREDTHTEQPSFPEKDATAAQNRSGDTQTPTGAQKASSEPQRQPEQPLMGKVSGDPFAESSGGRDYDNLKVTGSTIVRDPMDGTYHRVTMSDGSVYNIYRSDPGGDHGLGAWHIDTHSSHDSTKIPGPSQNGHVSDVLGFSKAEALEALPQKLKQLQKYEKEGVQKTPEQRAQDPATMGELKRMADNAGWQEEGGKLLRDAEGNAVARTQWIPNEPWFRAGMGEANVREAVARLENGKPLTKKHREIVESMLEWMDENEAATVKANRAEALVDNGIAESATRMADLALSERAALLYPDQFEELTMRHADSSHDEFMADVRRLLDGGTVQHPTETASRQGTGIEDNRGNETVSRQADRANEENARTGEINGQERPDLELEQPTEAGLRAKADETAAAERNQQKEQRAADEKAKADAEAKDFQLTGSERAADANPNQGDIFGSGKLYDVSSFVGENIKSALKSSLGWAEQKIGNLFHRIEDPVFNSKDGTPSTGLLDYLNRKLADNFAYVEKVQEAVKAAGKEIDEAADTVMAHRLLSGRTGDRLRTFDEGIMAKLHEAITTASKNKGITLDDINDFLYARHAPERNRQISKINSGNREGSGISDKEASDILAKFAASGKTAALERIAAEFDKVTAFERQTLADAGLISKETLKAWKEAYKNYAPLKGEESESAFATASGGGFSSSSKYARATGRFSRAENLIERAVMNAQLAVIRAEKAEVGRAFLKFITDNPNSAIVTGVDKLPVKAKIKGDGSVGYEVDGLSAMKDNVMHVVDRNGETHSITFAENEAGALMARALNGMGARESGIIVKTMGKLSRLYSSLQTKWNPEFVVTNALRDVQTALGTVGTEFGPKMAAKVLSDYTSAGKAIMANESGGKIDFSSKDWKAWHDRFRAAGGETHFVSVDDIKATSKRLGQAVASGHSVLQPDGAWQKTREIAGKTFGIIDVMNSSIENSLRLSVFKNLVESGVSEKKAAVAAKEVTVNFNRHGEFGPAINAAYVFFNAAVQGQLRIVRMFKANPTAAAKYAASLASVGAGLAQMNYMLTDYDEDGRSYYDKVPSEIRNRWAVLMLPQGWADSLREYAPSWMIPSAEETNGQLYLKLFPMAYGMNMFYNTGSGMVEAAHNMDDGKLAREILAKRVLSTVVDSFNPFGQNSMVQRIVEGEYSKAAGEATKLVSPTVADPFVELMLNSNFMGSKIYKEQQERSTEPNKPNSEVAFKKTSDTSKAVARWLNEQTGGSDLRSGGIDLSADKLDYLAGYFSGGAGRFLLNAGKTVGDAAEGKTPDYKRVPFARLFAGDSRGAPYDHFQDAQHEVQLAAKEMKLGRETNTDLARLHNEEKATADFIKDQRKLLAKVQADPRFTDDEIHEREQAINRRIESRMKQFLGKYYDAGGQKKSY